MAEHVGSADLVPRTMCMAVAAAMTWLAAPARAVAAPQCPVDPTLGPVAAVDPQAVYARTVELEAQIMAGARRARIWSVGWGTTLGVAAVGQAGWAAAARRRGTKIDLGVGAASALVGVGARVVVVSPVLRAARRLRRAGSSGDHDCARLHRAERAVAAGAAWEQRARSLTMHALSLSFSAAVGVVLGVAFRRPVSASRQVMLGGVTGQVMILTTPNPMNQVRAAYVGGERPAPLRWVSTPLFVRGGGGASLTGRF